MEQAIHDRQATANGLAGRGMPMVLMYHSVQPYTARKPLLDAAQVRRLAEGGVEIGSHAMQHVSRPTAHGALAAGTGGSRRILPDITGQPASGFCYPYGHLDAEVVTAVRAAGYDYGCAIWPSEYAGRHALPRTYIGAADTSPRLSGKAVRHWLTWARRGPGRRAIAAAGGLNFPHSA
jgi:peptidoglycan/xylan/chitin deacetylase (PgdA/CDA1 family)